MQEFLYVIGFGIAAMGIMWGKRWYIKILFGMLGVIIIAVSLLLVYIHRQS